MFAVCPIGTIIIVYQSGHAELHEVHETIFGVQILANFSLQGATPTLCATFEGAISTQRFLHIGWLSECNDTKIFRMVEGAEQ